MKTIIKNIIAAFSMYTTIKMPAIDLKKENIKYVFLVFPLLGLFIGGAEILLIYLFSFFKINKFFKAVSLLFLPVILTGGIHLDGFSDTSDAIFSRTEREKKLLIMKDPNIGTFAALSLIMLFLFSFSMLIGLKAPRILILYIFTNGRLFSALMVSSLAPAKKSGLLYAFSSAADKSMIRKVLIFYDLILSIILLIFFYDKGIKYLIFGIALLIILHIFYFINKSYIKKEFGGITGDISGWLLVRTEFLTLFIYFIFKTCCFPYLSF